MNMDHLELRDDDSEKSGGNANPKLNSSRNSGVQKAGDLTRFSGYRGSEMRMSQLRGSHLYSNMTPRLEAGNDLHPV
jgi:hypothetical protein